MESIVVFSFICYTVVRKTGTVPHSYNAVPEQEERPVKPYDTSAHYASVTSYYALSMLQYRMKPHSHDRHEIMYVSNGTCTVTADGREYLLHRHQFIFIAANVIHCLRVDEAAPCSILNLEFMFQKEKTKLDIRELLEESPYFQKFFSEIPAPCIICNSGQELEYALKDLIHHLELLSIQAAGCSSSGPFEEDFLSRILFLRFLFELTKCISDRKRSAGTQYVKLACEYINEHFQEDLQIPKIAARAGIHKSYLCSLFSQYQNCTILEYINRRRLEHAKFLLQTSSLSVTDVAFHSGFNSRQHFRTTFHKYERINPTEYRHLNRRDLQASTGHTKRMLQGSGVRSLPLAGSLQTSEMK